jgi:hypothetical protein
MLNSQAITKTIRDCLAIFSVIILLTISQSAFADTDSGQSPVDETQLGQKSKQELLDIMQRFITLHPVHY